MSLDDRAGLWLWGRRFRHATSETNEHAHAVVVERCDKCNTTSQVEYERLRPGFWTYRCLTCKPRTRKGEQDV